MNFGFFVMHVLASWEPNLNGSQTSFGPAGRSHVDRIGILADDDDEQPRPPTPPPAQKKSSSPGAKRNAMPRRSLANRPTLPKVSSDLGLDLPDDL